jgi:hypothetical protein
MTDAGYVGGENSDTIPDAMGWSDLISMNGLKDVPLLNTLDYLSEKRLNFKTVNYSR